MLTACTATPVEKIMDRLNEAASAGVPLYGHQDDLMYGHSWNVNVDGAQDFERSDIKSVCGQYPAVLGLELGGIELGDECSLDGVNFKYLAQAAVKHYERGGIVTLSWHPRNLVTGDSAWDVSNNTVVRSLLPGGENHDTFIQWLSRVCDEIELMRGKDGKVIPIIWRPWHEHTGSWFWWGWDLCTAEEYVSLWKMTYEYMMGVRKLDSLVWATSPDGNSRFDQWAERYPGEEYVDLLGFDMYFFGWDEHREAASKYYIDHMRECLASLSAFAAEHGKPIAVTETGCEGLKADNYWTGCLAKALEGFPVSYVLTWRNACDDEKKDYHFYGPFPGSRNADDFCDWVASGKVGMMK